MRPWLLGGISVSKQMVILIDTGNYMGTTVNGEFQRPFGTTYLNVEIDLALSLIQTLLPGDFVQVMSFNSSGATPLGPMVNVGNYDESGAHPELKPLTDTLKQVVHSADPRPSDLNDGIIKAASSFQNSTFNTLKVLK